jgi:hypothetical protein
MSVYTVEAIDQRDDFEDLFQWVIPKATYVKAPGRTW